VARPRNLETTAMDSTIYVDADACPVKDEIYKVALRHQLQVYVVSNHFIQTPKSPMINKVIVEKGPDAADNWIIEQVVSGDVVVTSDIPLAARALEKTAYAIAPYGKEFTKDSIGMALAQRSLMEQLREVGERTGGPAFFSPSHRSKFLQILNEAIVREKRRQSRSIDRQDHL